MDGIQALVAIRKTGERLQTEHPDMPVVSVYLVGGVAGMLTHELPASRTTGDCDVLDADPSDEWPAVTAAAQAVGQELGLRADWLNRECAVFAWQFPLGWRSRCRRLADYGRLRVMVLSRGDRLASKVMGAPKRVQDRDDLQTMRPTAAELDAVAEHLNRIESETEPGGCDPQRAIVKWLRDLR